MKLSAKNLYAYRVFTHNHTFMVQSPCQTIDELWEQVEQNRVIDFSYPDKKGGMIRLSVRSNTIEAIDTSYGTEPVSQLEGPKDDNRATNTRVQGGRIVIGQLAGKK